ncbi:MAG: translation initiation factor 1A [Promethearchaeota archaeon]
MKKKSAKKKKTKSQVRGKNRSKGKGRGKQTQAAPTGPIRVRYPQEGELLGIIVRALGDRRMEVLCADNQVRVARIPGRLRRGYRIRPNDVVIIEPWHGMQDDSRGDLVHRYLRHELRRLARVRDFRDTLVAFDVPVTDLETESEEP